MISRKRPSSSISAFPGTEIIRSPIGLTLLELIIALLVLQIALVAFAQFLTKALDYSRRVRRIEMAQILAQARMEELIRTIPAESTVIPPAEEGETSRILNERPGAFANVAYAHSEAIDPFRWVAEVAPSQNDPKLLGLKLYIYVVDKRIKEEKSSEPIEDFHVSDDREHFTYIHTLSDGSVEVMRGKEKLRVSSAVALP